MWLRLWVRCWVCPLFVRLPVCPLPFSQSTFHLCAVGCKSSWKWCSVSTSELLPACIHVRLCCSWFCFPPPLNLCCWSHCQGCSQRIGGWGGRGIHHQPLALGLGTRGYQQTVWLKRFLERRAAAGPVGVSLSFPFSVCLPLSLSHCLHTVFMWQLAHIIWFGRNCGL